jgi:hypothetical protein
MATRKSRTKDRHRPAAKVVLVRIGEDDWAVISEAVQIRQRDAGPGARVAVSKFLLDAALETARGIVKKADRVRG